MSLDDGGPMALDYFPCRYGTSKLLFRGPRRRLNDDYIAFLGSIETYGKFTQIPFPALVEHATGKKAVNLGCPNTGVDAYLNDQSLLGIAKNAKLTVIEVLGAQNMSNRYYYVHPRRNDRLVNVTPALKALFPNIDYTDFNFVRHLLVSLIQDDPAKFAWVERELKDVWLSHMIKLVRTIDGPVILLWLSDHPTGMGLEGDPFLIDDLMIKSITQHVANVVAVVAEMKERQAGFDELVFSATEEIAAQEMMGPVVHRRVANALVHEINKILK